MSLFFGTGHFFLIVICHDFKPVDFIGKFCNFCLFAKDILLQSFDAPLKLFDILILSLIAFLEELTEFIRPFIF